MPSLTVIRGDMRLNIPFSGNPPLKDVLESSGIILPHPCGGRGLCGKCRLKAKGALSETPDENGTVRACKARLIGDAEVTVPDTAPEMAIETGGGDTPASCTANAYPETASAAQTCPSQPDAASAYPAAAVDLGTTTIVLRLFGTPDNPLADAAALNPQTAVAADVMGRIGAALDGQLGRLNAFAADAIRDLLSRACAGAGLDPASVRRLCVTGNTTMLYLLTCRDPVSLSAAPFRADCLFDIDTMLSDIPAYLPPCMNAFVGADITCAVLASGMTESAGPALLMDLGTNGEQALWKDGVLYVTSTAAGPVFEGAGISCGCGSVPGAVDRVTVLPDKTIKAHTIGNKPPVGLCGSGLIDAVAAFLKTGALDETGATDADALEICDTVSLLPADIRAVQMAKAAVAAGLKTMLHVSGTQVEDISRLYLAGGFGSHLDPASAAAIGLIPDSLVPRTRVIGNAALTGACMLLNDPAAVISAKEIAAEARHVPLGGNPVFNQAYIEEMLFGHG